jgi:hypothetical protein
MGKAARLNRERREKANTYDVFMIDIYIRKSQLSRIKTGAVNSQVPKEQINTVIDGVLISLGLEGASSHPVLSKFVDMNAGVRLFVHVLDGNDIFKRNAENVAYFVKMQFMDILFKGGAVLQEGSDIPPVFTQKHIDGFISIAKYPNTDPPIYQFYKKDEIPDGFLW